MPLPLQFLGPLLLEHEVVTLPAVEVTLLPVKVNVKFRSMIDLSVLLGDFGYGDQWDRLRCGRGAIISLL